MRSIRIYAMNAPPIESREHIDTYNFRLIDKCFDKINCKKGLVSVHENKMFIYVCTYVYKFSK